MCLVSSSHVFEGQSTAIYSSAEQQDVAPGLDGDVVYSSLGKDDGLLYCILASPTADRDSHQGEKIRAASFPLLCRKAKRYLRKLKACTR